MELDNLDNLNDVESEELERRAREVLMANLRSGYDPFYGMNYSYVMPSPGRYTWQWFWDSCFHAVSLAHLEPDLAKEEIRTLVAAQRADGFIGHVTYWGRRGALISALHGQSRIGEWRARRSAMIQPPILAQAVEAVFDITGDEKFLSEMTPPTASYYSWLAMNRDKDGDGMIWIISPFESGMDNSPAFDKAMRLHEPGRFDWLIANRMRDYSNMLLCRNWNFAAIAKRGHAIMDPFVNAVYADGWRTLARLHRSLGDEASAAEATAKARRVGEALNRIAWDDEAGAFGHIRSSGFTSMPAMVEVLTISALFPAFLPETPPLRASGLLDDHLRDPAKFWTRFPVPIVSISEPSFIADTEKTIWRGPTNLGINWLFIRGLRKTGRNDVAQSIAISSRRAALKDFREFYSPLTGEGLRGKRFGWATLAVDM